LTARRWNNAGGGPLPSGAHAAGNGDPRRNLHMAFERVSASAVPAPGPDLEAGRAPFKFSDLMQAVRDVFALIFILLFLGITAAAVGIALFILLFVGLR
jgi:hypothetical protein